MAAPPFTLAPSVAAPTGPSSARGGSVEFFAPFNVGAEPAGMATVAERAIPYIGLAVVAWLMLRRR